MTIRDRWERMDSFAKRVTTVCLCGLAVIAFGAAIWNGSRTISSVVWRWSLREVLEQIEAGRTADAAGAVRDSALTDQVTNIGARQKTESELVLRALEARPGSRAYREAVRQLRELRQK